MSERGFSLLEVLVALCIAAFAVAIALPAMPRGPSRLDAEGAVREITGSLREARAAAIARNRPVSFTIDVQKGVFGYDGLQPLRLRTASDEASLHLVAYGADDPKRPRASAVIRFFPDGGSSGGGIEVGTGAQRSLVLVDWLSGQVSVTHVGTGG